MRYLVGIYKSTPLALLVLVSIVLLYLTVSSDGDKRGAQVACKEAYPTYTEVVAIVGLDIGTVCFDESGGTVKFLGVLEE